MLSTTTLTSLEQIGLECHFNWKICDGFTENTLTERIHANKAHILTNAANILPQSYCFLAYLQSKSSNEEIKNESYDNLLKAQKALEDMMNSAITKYPDSTWKFGLGYKAVILGNLAAFLNSNKHHINHKNTLTYYKEYQKIAEQYEERLDKHPEVLAMKAFALGSFGHKWAKESVDVYKEALLHDQYKDRSEWLFGLALSKNFVISKKQPLAKEELFELEVILRRVIQLDEKEPLPMLRLAKTLWKRNNFETVEEIVYWVERALETNRKLSIIEGAGDIYRFIGCNEKALKLFQESEKIDPNSKNTVNGLGQTYLDNYYKNRKLNEYSFDCGIIPEDLQKACDYFKRNMEIKRHFDRLNLAKIYEEMSKFDVTYLSKAEDLYKEVYNDTKQEKDLVPFAKACTCYCDFLKNQNKIAEEIIILKETIEITFEQNSEKDESSDSKNLEPVKRYKRFVGECQRRLLKYASSRTHMTETEALLLKGYIEVKRGEIHSAIFYCRKSIEVTVEDDKSKIKEALAECLLKASRTKHTIYAGDLPKRCFDEAKDILKELDPSDKKYELEFTATKYEISDKMGENEVLSDLKLLWIEFESFHLKKNKDVLHKRRKSSESTEREEEELAPVLNIISKSKTLLDCSMNKIKTKIYHRDQNDKPFCTYPTPKKLTKGKSLTLTEKMKELLVNEYKFRNFDTDHKTLFQFLIDKQPNGGKRYDWFSNYIKIRNAEEHNRNGREELLKNYPTSEERKELTRNVCDYTIEVVKGFEQEIQ